MENFCDWLAATPISLAFQSWAWFVPSVQTVHILCVAVVLTSAYVIALRLLGLPLGKETLAQVTAKSMPWIWIALIVLLATGTLLTITEPARELLNWVFRAKMLMVLFLAGLLRVNQGLLRRDERYWSESPQRRTAARGLGGVCLVIGAAIVTAGRWIA